MLDLNISEFCAQTSENDQSKLLNNEYMTQKGINNKQILRDVRFAFTLSSNERDALEHSEICALQNMLLFT